MQRFKRAPRKRLSRVQSGQVWNSAKVLAKATGVFGFGLDAAERWLEAPAIGRDGRRPDRNWLATAAGMGLVEESPSAARIRRLRLTPLPPPLGSGELVAWRLHRAVFRDDWHSGDGAFRWGGRWNGRGVRAVYCSLDPATAILEVGGACRLRRARCGAAFDDGDHYSRCGKRSAWSSPARCQTRPGCTLAVRAAAQRAYGDALLAQHAAIAIPSTISAHGWNLIFTAANAAGVYLGCGCRKISRLDPRLRTPVP